MKNCPAREGIPKSEEQDTAFENNCCNTATDFVKLDEDQVEVSLGLNLTDYPVLSAVLVPVDGLKLIEQDDKTTQYLTYKPPLLVYDLPVSLQTFLC